MGAVYPEYKLDINYISQLQNSFIVARMLKMICLAIPIASLILMFWMCTSIQRFDVALVKFFFTFFVQLGYI